MGKGKTAQRAARATFKEPPPPPKPKKDAWHRNPAYHQYDGTGKACLTCKKEKVVHCLPGECQTARRIRLGL